MQRFVGQLKEPTCSLQSTGADIEAPWSTYDYLWFDDTT